MAKDMDARWKASVVCAAAVVLLAACGRSASLNGVPRGIAVQAKPLPRGVMSAHRACALVLRRPRGTFVGVKQVHLVLTTYAKGEPVESRGDYSAGTPPRTLVWVVEVHAKAIHVPTTGPPGARPLAATDYSVVMNAETGSISDIGLGRAWPLPLWKAGTMISLPAQC